MTRNEAKDAICTLDSYIVSYTNDLKRMTDDGSLFSLYIDRIQVVAKIIARFAQRREKLHKAMIKHHRITNNNASADFVEWAQQFTNL